MRYSCAILDDYQRVALSLDGAGWSRLEGRVDLRAFHAPLGNADAIAAQLQDFDIIVLMRERTPITQEIIARLPKLKLIVTTGTVNASLDVDAAARRNIVCCGTRGSGGTTPTAQVVFGLILELARHIGREAEGMRRGAWQTTLGEDIEQKTLGIVGLGRIGTKVAKIAAAFGMPILAWSTNLTEERARAAGATLVSKDELFSRSDIVSVSLMLSERTRGIVDAAAIGRMKPTAWLINTARSGLVDQSALIHALRTGAIAAAGLDVFDIEPLPQDHPFRTLPNVVATPHLGYLTRDYFEKNYAGAVEDICAWLDGAPIRVIAPSQA